MKSQNLIVKVRIVKMTVAIWYDKNNTDSDNLMIVTSMDTEAELEKIVLEIDPEVSIVEQVKKHLGV